jgi:hypothetical protein
VIRATDLAHPNHDLSKPGGESGQAVCQRLPCEQRDRIERMDELFGFLEL